MSQTFAYELNGLAALFVHCDCVEAAVASALPGYT